MYRIVIVDEPRRGCNRMVDVRRLLEQPEGTTLEFKREAPDISRLNDRRKSKLVKTILAMANTPRETPSYIVFGVDVRPDGNKRLCGITEDVDDADLQQLVRSKVNIVPTFLYCAASIGETRLGIIEVPVDPRGPFAPSKSFGVLEEGAVYYRQGSMNATANSTQVRRIETWMRNELRTEPALDHWDELSEICHGFTNGMNYILVLPAVRSDATLAAIGRIPCAAVIDFCTNPEAGAFASVVPTLRQHRMVHQVVGALTVSLAPEAGTYWYSAAGLKKPRAPDSWRAWVQEHLRSLNRFLDRLAEALSHRPTLVVICLGDADYASSICEACAMSFGGSAEYAFITQPIDGIKEVAERFGARCLPLTLEGFARALREGLPAPTSEHHEVAIPRHPEGSVTIAHDSLLYIREHMEVVDLDAGVAVPEDPSELRGFFRGRTCTWHDLSRHADVERDLAEPLERQIAVDLYDRTTTRITLFHYPGAGGTTLGRRLAWKFHKRYPTVVLNRIVPNETIERFQVIYELSTSSILALVDGRYCSADEVGRLFEEVRSRNIPVVFLCVFRREEFVGSDRPRTQYLRTMRHSERVAFFNRYAEQVPERRPQLARLLASENQRFSTPFIFGLTAFEKDYEGISEYVQARVHRLTGAQKKLLVCIAMSHRYGQLGFPVNLFNRLFGLRQSELLRMDRVLPAPVLDLLIEEQAGLWRPLHILVSRELIEQILAGEEGDRRNWATNLSSWALTLIEVCCGYSGVTSRYIYELLRRVFLLRDSRDVLGTETAKAPTFSPIIEDIPTLEGKRLVLDTLAERFPDEPHYWGHLGRFLSSAATDYYGALEAVDRALSLSPEDHVLHHMKGMCLRALLYQLIDQPNPLEVSVAEVREAYDTAAGYFGNARDIEEDDEHGYISHVQMALKVIDFGFRASGMTSRREFLTSSSASWYRELLDEAEGLLEAARYLREGERDSEYVLRCRAELDELYEDYSKILEGWNNLLDRPGVYSPPIRRQIARVHLMRAKRSWDALDETQLRRIADSMRANILEEPHNDQNVRLWFNAVRRIPRESIDRAIEQLLYWGARSTSIEPKYYVYVLYALKAIQGHSMDLPKALDALDECRQLAKAKRNRSRSFEWLGHGDGMSALVNHRQMGEWNDRIDFWENIRLLKRVSGRILEIKRAEAGEIELDSGLRAFFVPARGKCDSPGGFLRGQHENRRVSFLLGFSFDGLRAWDVRPAGIEAPLGGNPPIPGVRQL